MALNQLMPLRVTVGKPIPIVQARLVERSPLIRRFVADFSVHPNLEMALQADFSNFLPESLVFPPDKTAYTPFVGVDSLPRPPRADYPFGNNHPVLSLQGLLSPNFAASSRELWVDVEIQFEKPVLLGGLCYAGYPFLPYYVTPHGENSANFGLPREISLRWQRTQSDFLDDETTFTSQQPIAHSGIHYLPTGPIKTDRLVLRLADWPQFITQVDLIKSSRRIRGGAQLPENHREEDSCPLQLREQFGFLMPYLVPYEYTESSRYDPHVPAGLLACVKRPGQSVADFFCNPEENNDTQAPTHLPPEEAADRDEAEPVVAADFIYSTHRPGNYYFPLSAASLFGQKRRFQVRPNGRYPEHFSSVLLAPEEQIFFYIEQAEEHVRSLSGLQIDFVNARLPGILPRQKITASVYEIDFVEGVSPINFNVNPAQDKYHTLLYQGQATPAQPALICKFRKPSLSRYLLLVMTNSSDQVAQISLGSLELLQSAHITVGPRASRTQVIETMHYRLIGADLTADYARLGADGFSLAVESVVAGQQKDVLFQAHSLLGLLQTGTAQVHANHRRLETKTDVSREVVRTHEGSKSRHVSQARSKGWRRSETGDGVHWQARDEFSQPPDNPYGFTTVNNAEVRTFSEYVGHEGVASTMKHVKEILDLLADIADDTMNLNISDLLPENIFNQPPRLLRPDDDNFNWEDRVWRGLAGVTWVDVVKSLTLPGFALAHEDALEELGEAIQAVRDWLQNPISFPNGPDLDAMFTLNPASILSGLSVGLSVGIQVGAGGSLTFSGSPLLPTIANTSNSGTSGIINKQASKSGYVYSQMRNYGYDGSEVETAYGEGEMVRTVTRRLNRDGTEKERTHGAEVMWQGELVDIVTGRIPLGLTLPATADNIYRTADQALRVRFGSAMDRSIEVDVWFDVREELVREDY